MMNQGSSEYHLIQEARNRLSSALSTASWTDGDPNDQLANYKARMIRGTRVQTSPPSVAAEAILMKGSLTADLEGKPIIKGRVSYQMSDYGRRLMRELPAIQVTHRSRPANLMSSRLQLNEIQRRIQNKQTHMETLNSLSLPSRLADEVNSLKRDALVKRLDLNIDTLTKFIKEHEKSSIAPGLKWGQLSATDKIFVDLYDNIKQNAEENFFSGKPFNAPFNLGARARADQFVSPGVTHMDLEVTRTRIVMFHPAFLPVFAFVPDKKGFYKEVVEGVFDIFEINDHVLSPVIHGGEVYGAASEAMRGNEDVTIVLGDDVNIYKSGKQWAFDGANWESSVGTILGPPFYGTKSFFGNSYHLPSGVFDTTIDGTIASLWVYSQSEEMRKGQDIPGIMERQEQDEEVNFMLGMSYAADPDHPRLQGLKMSLDRADSIVPLPPGRNLELVQPKRTDEQRERWYLGYHGTTPDGGSLLDFLTKIEPEEFKSGYMTRYVENGGEVE